MTTALDKCSCGGVPVEQIRGEMKSQDFHDILKRGLPDDAAKGHELYDGLEGERGPGHAGIPSTNKTDFRVCCPSCGKATGWNKRDLPQTAGIPLELTQGVIAEATRKKWNEMQNAEPNPATHPEEWKAWHRKQAAA